MPRREMAHGVAAYHETLAGSHANGSIQLIDDFGRGLRRAGCEAPAVACERRSHLVAQSAEDVERGVVVLDQLEAPLAQPDNVVGDFLSNVGHTRVENASVARKAPAFRRVRGRLQRTNPGSRARSNPM